VITTQRVVPLTESTRAERLSVIDGWYIDLDTGLTCEPWWAGESGHGFLIAHKLGDEPVRPTFENIGEPERGYPVQFRSEDGDSLVETEVVALSTAALDPSLFDVPAGFSRVEQIRQEPVPPLVIRLRQTYDRLKRHARLGA